MKVITRNSSHLSIFIRSTNATDDAHRLTCGQTTQLRQFVHRRQSTYSSVHRNTAAAAERQKDCSDKAQTDCEMQLLVRSSIMHCCTHSVGEGQTEMFVQPTISASTRGQSQSLLMAQCARFDSLGICSSGSGPFATS